MPSIIATADTAGLPACRSESANASGCSGSFTQSYEGLSCPDTLNFLIASPMVNEIAIGLLFSLSGWQVTAIYISAGLIVAIVAGWSWAAWACRSWSNLRLRV